LQEITGFLRASWVASNNYFNLIGVSLTKPQRGRKNRMTIHANLQPRRPVHSELAIMLIQFDWVVV